jgi:hypothetical protein
MFPYMAGNVEVNTKALLGVQNWERRWFVVEHSFLYLFKSRDRFEAVTKVYLPGCKVKEADTKDRQQVFCV